MQLAQGTRSAERGFAMAGLLVSIALLSLALSVAMPAWKTLAQREKEEELIWRGQQYDRAIQLYRKKNAAPGAPSVDKLVEGRFLRKKYKDPITNADFELIGVSQAGNAPGVQQPQRGFGQLVGGVRSKSKAKSLRVFNGRTVYSEWQFTYVPWKPGGQPTTPGGAKTPGSSPGASPGSRPGTRPGAAPGITPGGRSGFSMTSDGEGVTVAPLPKP
jgi:type II secretory pathway pseudopilin PulG